MIHYYNTWNNTDIYSNIFGSQNNALLYMNNSV